MPPSAPPATRSRRNLSSVLAFACLVAGICTEIGARAATVSLSAPGKVVTTEICVYGGTSSGVMAAIQARRLGRKVALVSQGNRLGGMTISGLSATDSGNRLAIGGLAREFYQRIRDAYLRSYGADSPQAKDCLDGYRFEPRVAEKVFQEMLAEAGVPIYLNQRLKSARLLSNRIVELGTMEGMVFKASVYIDATYEGDLMAKANVTYTVGREANSRYNETLNGVQLDPPFHNFLLPVDPYVIEGNPASGLLPTISPNDPGRPGSGDRKVQAYCFRMCLTNVPDNRLPFPRPRVYDQQRYALLLRYLRAGGWEGLDDQGKLPNGKIDCNNKGAFSLDNIGANHLYPDGDAATRKRIVLDHINYQQGLMYFLATDDRVPPNVREDVNQWGLCRDEFSATGGWPHDLYIREARRMVSDYVMTEHNCRGTISVDDSIGLASYPMDSHNVQRVVRDGVVQNEGDVQVSGFPPYPISYRSIAPAEGECENLLVPVCLSASHIAFGSIRMEPIFMILGQSAATAASFMILDRLPSQGIDLRKLQIRLREDGQVLGWQGNGTLAAGGSRPPMLPPPPDPKTLKGIVLDDPDAAKEGMWTAGTRAAEARFGPGFVHDANADKGRLTATYRPEIPEDGTYTIIVITPSGPDRASNVPVTLAVEGVGSTTFRLNQKLGENNGFAPLGTFKLPKGKLTTVTISNRGTDGLVAVDGLQIIPISEMNSGGG